MNMMKITKIMPSNIIKISPLLKLLLIGRLGSLFLQNSLMDSCTFINVHIPRVPNQDPKNNQINVFNPEE
jgi:hypothetical protein